METPIAAQPHDPQPGEPSRPNRHSPSPGSTLKYHFAVQVFRMKRRLEDAQHPTPRHQPCELPKNWKVIAESRTPLWSETDPAEQRLQMGKVQNLRVACRGLNRIRVPAGEVFSFWKQVGYPSKARGFVEGRQLQEGCIVPAIAGGICQLSNALHDLALRTGMEIIERHGHSRRVPNSAVPEGRDATVAWNYIDLRFRAKADFIMSATLTSEELVVQVFSEAELKTQTVPLLGKEAYRPRSVLAHSCETCGESECHQHQKINHTPIAGKAGYLVDQYWPEFDAYIHSVIQKEDTLCAPIDGARFRMTRYAWDAGVSSERAYASLATLRRAWVSRKLSSQGPQLRMAAFGFDEELARIYGEGLRYDVRRLSIYQSLLPFLWREGTLGGRNFEVMMQRLPIFALQQILDEEFAKHPDRRLLSDYRAPEWIVKTEREALDAAEKIITPHAYIASLYPHKAVLLDWQSPQTKAQPKHGDRVAFPGPSIARKGAYEVREAARQLGFKVRITGANHEGEVFWDGVDVDRPSQGSSWLDGVGMVVQPALLEDQPRKLLQALAAGIPVIASPQCGLSARPGLTLVPYGDADALIAAMEQARKSG